MPAHRYLPDNRVEDGDDGGWEGTCRNVQELGERKLFLGKRLVSILGAKDSQGGKYIEKSFAGDRFIKDRLCLGTSVHKVFFNATR